MSAFEIRNESGAAAPLNDRVREECIIAFKVYDFCRQQDCLNCDTLGPARAECRTTIGDITIQEGDIIEAPSNAAAVSINNLVVKRVIVSDKKENPFRNGFWDITLKYVFSYDITFREADGRIIDCVRANSIFSKQVTLFGSIGTDVTIFTDLLGHGGHGGNSTSELSSDPFVFVESKAIPLSAELRNQTRCCSAVGSQEDTEFRDVCVTIGLFTIIKLFRLVNLSVLSRGFCIPEECEEVSSLNACEFFDSLDFPMDIFAPPQKREFLAGISGNIPHSTVSNVTSGGCGCGCSNSNVSNTTNSSRDCGCGCGN